MKNCPKTRYGSEEFALAAVRRMKVRQGREIPSRPYLCFCGAWHLTRQPNFQELQAEIKKFIQADKNRNIELEKEVLVDERIRAMKKQITALTKQVKQLRQDNSILVGKNLQLEKQIKDRDGELV